MLHFDLEKVILGLGETDPSKNWRIRDAVEGLQIFGGIGSGKTSGSGQTVAQRFLENQFGGLVLTAKTDEKDAWIKLCQKTGRLNDLIVVEPSGDYFFNFLDYESRNADGEITPTGNIVQVLKTVIKASEEKSSGKSDDPFWETALDMLIFNTIDLCILTKRPLSIDRMFSIVQSIPKKGADTTKSKPSAFSEAFNEARENVANQIDVWEKNQSVEFLAGLTDNAAIEFAIGEGVPDSRTLKTLDQFFYENFINLSEKTRSIIEFTFSGFLFRLLKEPVYSLFCSRSSNFKPEDCLEGKIIILNLPVKKYHKVGQDCQIMFKYIWQRAMERRKIGINGRPVFLWADEAQHFLHEYDAEYQATARSSRIATVYISQNLPNYYANMGGTNGEYRVKSFLGTLATKIFHANADIETNLYASDLIGQAYTADHSSSTTVAGEFSSSRSVGFSLEKMVRPEEFMVLRTGSESNSGKVDGYLHKQGTVFKNGASFKKITFTQNS